MLTHLRQATEQHQTSLLTLKHKGMAWDIPRPECK